MILYSLIDIIACANYSMISDSLINIITHIFLLLSVHPLFSFSLPFLLPGTGNRNLIAYVEHIEDSAFVPIALYTVPSSIPGTLNKLLLN